MNGAAIVSLPPSINILEPRRLTRGAGPNVLDLCSRLEIRCPASRPLQFFCIADRNVFLPKRRVYSPHSLPRSCVKEALVALFNECQLPSIANGLHGWCSSHYPSEKKAENAAYSATDFNTDRFLYVPVTHLGGY
jgi:hypothetical protein